MLCSVYELSVATEHWDIVNLLMKKKKKKHLVFSLSARHTCFKKLIMIIMPSFAMDVKDEGGFQRQRNSHSELDLMYE